jgi:hypothetical protein
MGTDWAAAVAAVGIFALIWLRTKVQYRHLSSPLRLTRAGWQYFGGALVLMALGAVLAPRLAPALRLKGAETLPMLPTVLRVLWFLATYYVFIVVHNLLKARGAAVFSGAQEA